MSNQSLPQRSSAFIPPPLNTTDLTAILTQFIEQIKTLVQPIIQILSTFTSLIPIDRTPRTLYPKFLVNPPLEY